MTTVATALTTLELVTRGRPVTGRRWLVNSACLFITGALAQWTREFQAL